MFDRHCCTVSEQEWASERCASSGLDVGCVMSFPKLTTGPGSASNWAVFTFCVVSLASW